MRGALAAAAALAMALAAAGCGGEGPASSDGADGAAGGAEPAVWSLSEEPLLEIGVVSGEEPYQLHRVTSSARLPDGRIVVANAGSSELRFFDAEGNHLMSRGTRGEAPGEWLGIARVRSLAPDTLLVVDTGQRRNGLVSTDGEYLGTLPWREDQLFPSDQFLYGRMIVDAPLPPEERGVVVRAIERSAEPDTGRLAFALATPTGRVWVTEDPEEAPAGRAWRVYDLEGRPVATLRTPSRFAVHDVGPDWVLGVARDEVDVQYLRLYRLDGAAGGGRDALAEAARASDREPPTFDRWPTDSFPELRSLVRNMASAQEMHYSEHYRYTTSVDTLLSAFRDVPEDVRFEPLVGDARGWMWRVVDEESGGGCMLSYGSGGVMGMTPGALVCFAPPGTGGGGGAAGAAG